MVFKRGGDKQYESKANCIKTKNFSTNKRRTTP